MIAQYFFPSRGGGWLRRYWQYRQQIVSLEWRTSDGKPLPPLTLFDFTRAIDSADAMSVTNNYSDGWRVSDDRVIGGFSTSKGTLVTNESSWKNHLEQHEGDIPSKLEEKSSVEKDDVLSKPFLRWYGRLDTTIGLDSKAQRSGFSALRSPDFSFDGANLRGLYNSLEIQCRETTLLPLQTSSGSNELQTSNTEREDYRVYTVNLKVSSSLPDDIYQGSLLIQRDDLSDDDAENRPFLTFVLPFDEFRLTARGRDREFSRRLDDNIKIESVGLVLMDGVNDDFQFDLARVRAVNRLDDGSIYDDLAGTEEA